MTGTNRSAANDSPPGWTEDKELAAFAAVPEPNTARAKELLPELVEACELIARTQGLHWLMASVPLAAVAPQLSPNDQFELCKSIEVSGSLWVTLLHPGSINTSGMLRLLVRAMEKIYDLQNAHDKEQAKAQHDGEVTRLLDAHKADHDGSEAGFKPPKFVPPPKRKGLAGGGSLAAAGYFAAQPQNRSSMTALEPELEGILSWLMCEFAIDVSVAAKLWDSITWSRPVMKQSNGFEMRNPFFSFVAGGHLKELLKALVKDVFGLRQRLTAVYATPLFLDLEDIEEAEQRLPEETQYKVAKFVALLLYPLLRWSLKKEAVALAAGDDPGAHFKPAGADAMKTVRDKFNMRNQKQSACFLQPGMHAVSKYNGKLKTKYDRMVTTLAKYQSLMFALPPHQQQDVER
jgi:hypothetical protein